MRSSAVALLALAFTACGGPLSEAQAQFDAGRYPEAKQTFASMEAASRAWDDALRARYALYRGLTFGALGDHGHAALWLREAKAIEDTHPSSLSQKDTQRLRLALDADD